MEKISRRAFQFFSGSLSGCDIVIADGSLSTRMLIYVSYQGGQIFQKKPHVLRNFQLLHPLPSRKAFPRRACPGVTPIFCVTYMSYHSSSFAYESVDNL